MFTIAELEIAVQRHEAKRMTYAHRLQPIQALVANSRPIQRQSLLEDGAQNPLIRLDAKLSPKAAQRGVVSRQRSRDPIKFAFRTPVQDYGKIHINHRPTITVDLVGKNIDALFLIKDTRHEF